MWSQLRSESSLPRAATDWAAHGPGRAGLENPGPRALQAETGLKIFHLWYIIVCGNRLYLFNRRLHMNCTRVLYHYTVCENACRSMFPASVPVLFLSIWQRCNDNPISSHFPAIFRSYFVIAPFSIGQKEGNNTGTLAGNIDRHALQYSSLEN